MTAAIKLPEIATDVLAGRTKARDISEALHTAYWLHGRSESTALYMLTEAHKSLHELAAEMGYRLTPLADVEDAA